MGQGGYINLVNSTDSDWILDHTHSYQMNSWKFPKKILKKTSAKVYIEWDQGIFKHQKDDAGEARYILNDKSSFEIQARAEKEFNLRVYYKEIKVNGNNIGDVVNLGWAHDGVVNFVLLGNSGQYKSMNSNFSSWMSDSLSVLGNVPIRKLCIPGTHDSGMSKISTGTAFGFECNTVTQTHDIKKQLSLGSRYFDIRPVISGGQYYTGHYSEIEIKGISTWQGANGQSIKSIIDDINDFTRNHKELIVLNISHTLNTDVGNSKYRIFNKSEYENLFLILTSIENLYISDNYSNQDLTKLKLKEFIREKSAVLVIIEDSEFIRSSKYLGKGFYPYNDFKVYNKYSNTNNFSNMYKDQLNKMKEKMPSEYFLLSWTLTQNEIQATTCNLRVCSSIKHLAKEANENLFNKIFPEIQITNFPNIIYIDDIKSNEVALLALAINYFVNA